jgi:hypothetical protein
MNDRLCNLFELCETPEAPLCPMRQTTVEHGRWYADEQICKARKFQNLPWIRKQKRIAGLGLTVDDGFFTVRMLNSIQATAITKNLKGADPDYLISELNWLEQRAEKRASAEQKTRSRKAAPSKVSVRAVSLQDPYLWIVSGNGIVC